MRKSNILNIYQPESRARRKLRAFSFGRRRTLWLERKVHRTELLGLSQAVIFWFLLLFSFRIGTIIFFSLARDGSPYGLPVTPTLAHMNSWYSTKQGTIQVWVTKYEEMAVNGRYVNLENLEKTFRRSHQNKNANRLFLYVDRDCKMGFVLQIISLARANGFNEFIFANRQL